MTDGLKDAHREAITAVIAANDRVERAMLFGSRATGTNIVSSDVDIALFGNRLTLTDQARLAASLDEIPMAQSVDLVLYDSIHNRTLREHIRQQGIELYTRPNHRMIRCGTSVTLDVWPVMSLREAGVSLIDCEHRTPPVSEDGYPYVGIPQIKDGRIDLRGARRIAPEHFRKWTRKADPQPFDIVLSRRCNPGDTAFVSPRFAEFALGQNLVLLRSDEESLLKPFLRWLVRSPEWWVQVDKYINVGAVFDSLKCADVPSFRLPIPPFTDQRTIAHMLGTLDDKIELNRRMNTTLEAMARALFKSWFVDFDPVRAKTEGQDTGLPKEISDLFPDRLVDSELGDIPEGWRHVPVGDLASVRGGKQLPKSRFVQNGPVPVFGGAGLMGHTDAYNAEGYVITVGRVGAYCGQFFAHRGRVWVNNNASHVSHDERVPGEWLLLTLQHLNVDLIKKGAAQPFISNSDLVAMIVVEPSKTVLEAFRMLSESLSSRSFQIENETRTLVALRDALLPKLVSGELRVTALEPPSGRADRPASGRRHED